MTEPTPMVKEFGELLDSIPFEFNNPYLINAEEYAPRYDRMFEIIEQSGPIERGLIRAFLREKSERLHKFVHYCIPVSEEEDPERFLHLHLIKAAIRDGSPDFRDDLLLLGSLWEIAEEHGLDAEKMFREASAFGAGWLIEQILDPGRRQELIGSMR